MLPVTQPRAGQHDDHSLTAGWRPAEGRHRRAWPATSSTVAGHAFVYSGP